MIVAPSILSANFNNLLEDVKKCEESGASFLHIDVMDGHFVPNISFGAVAIKNLRKHTRMIFDVHLMISDPLKYAKDFIDVGADVITFHYEIFKDKSLEAITYLKNLGIKVGISLKPKTNIEVLKPFLSYLDMVLVMSVEPGFGGQKFIEKSLEKIRLLSQWKKDNHYQYLIEVDGGINLVTASQCKDSGCEIIVAGSYIFGSDDIKKQVQMLMGV